MKKKTFITLNNGKKIRVKNPHMARDMKSRKNVRIIDPKVTYLKNGRKAISGISPITGHKVFKITG